MCWKYPNCHEKFGVCEAARELSLLDGIAANAVVRCRGCHKAFPDLIEFYDGSELQAHEPCPSLALLIFEAEDKCKITSNRRLKK